MSPSEIAALEARWWNGGAAAVTPNEFRGLFLVLKASEAVLATWESTQSTSTRELRKAIDELHAAFERAQGNAAATRNKSEVPR